MTKEVYCQGWKNGRKQERKKGKKKEKKIKMTV